MGRWRGVYRGEEGHLSAHHHIPSSQVGEIYAVVPAKNHYSWIIVAVVSRHFSVTVEGEGSSNGMLDVLLRCTSSGAKVKLVGVCVCVG